MGPFGEEVRLPEEPSDGEGRSPEGHLADGGQSLKSPLETMAMRAVRNRRRAAQEPPRAWSGLARAWLAPLARMGRDGGALHCWHCRALPCARRGLEAAP